jgi:hypothetical protein
VAAHVRPKRTSIASSGTLAASVSAMRLRPGSLSVYLHKKFSKPISSASTRYEKNHCGICQHSESLLPLRNNNILFRASFILVAYFHCKKRPGIIKLFLARECLVSDIPAEDGTNDYLFYSVD